MRSALSRFLLLSAVLTLLFGLASSGLFAGIARAEADNRAVDRYGACLAGQKAGDLLLLIDESGSLKDTDPAAARVKAGQYLLDTLARYADRTSAKLDVAIAGFSEDFQMRQDWTGLNGGSVDNVKIQLAQLANNNSGADTDYFQALDGARSQLATRAKGDANRCQAIAWFTDGKIDFTKRPGTRSYAPGVDLNTDDGVNQAITAATEAICKKGGLADQLRTSKIVMLAVGLGDQQSDQDFDVLSAIATGKGVAGKSCGSITDPVPGGFYRVSNIDDMLFAFDALNPDPKIEDTKPVCQPGQPCQEGRHNFVLDRSVKTVTILGSGGVAGIEPWLYSPTGAKVELPKKDGKSETTLDGIPVSYEWKSESAQEITIAGPDNPAWVGQWALVYVDTTGQHADAISKTNIHITTDIFPAVTIDDAKPWRAGQVTKGVVFGLVDGKNKPIDPSSIAGDATLSASVAVDGSAPVQVLKDVPKTAIATPVDVDLTSLKPGAATVKMSLTIKTAAPLDPEGKPVLDAAGKPIEGTVLSPQNKDIPITLAPKLGLPVPGDTIKFGDVEGTKATAKLEVTGPGCVWIADGSKPDVPAAPEALGTVSVSSPSNGGTNCLKIDEGQKAELQVDLSTDHADNASLNGKVTLNIAPKDKPNESETMVVAFNANMIKPISPLNFVLALIAALLLGPGIPLALLYLSKWYVGKIPGAPMLAQRIPVEIDHGVLLRDGEPFELAETDLVTPVPGLASGVRTLTVEGVTLKVVLGRSPFGTAHVRVDAPGLLSAGSELPSTDESGVQAVLPLAVHGKWVLLHDPRGPQDRAEVLIMVGGQTDIPAREKLFEEIERKLPDMLSGLRARAGAANLVPVGAGASDPSPFGGDPMPGPGGDPFGGDPFTGDAFGAEPFGASPSFGAPAGGGFGAPPSGGFGAPAGGGFGAPPSGGFDGPGGGFTDPFAAPLPPQGPPPQAPQHQPPQHQPPMQHQPPQPPPMQQPPMQQPPMQQAPRPGPGTYDQPVPPSAVDHEGDTMEAPHPRFGNQPAPADGSETTRQRPINPFDPYRGGA